MRRWRWTRRARSTSGGCAGCATCHAAMAAFGRCRGVDVLCRLLLCAQSWTVAAGGVGAGASNCPILFWSGGRRTGRMGPGLRLKCNSNLNRLKCNGRALEQNGAPRRPIHGECRLDRGQIYWHALAWCHASHATHARRHIHDSIEHRPSSHMHKRATGSDVPRTVAHGHAVWAASVRRLPDRLFLS